MPPEQQQKKSEFYAKKFLWDIPTNWFKKTFGVGRRRSYEIYERPGEPQEALIKREPEMRELKALKNKLLAGTDYGLGYVEQLWNITDSMIVDEKPLNLPPQSRLVGATQTPDVFVPGIYSQLGPYTNIYNLVYEMKYYLTGANYKIEEVSISMNEIKQDAERELEGKKREDALKTINSLSDDERRRYEEGYKYMKVSIEGGDLIWDQRDPAAKEKVYSFGRLNVGPLLERLGTFADSWTREAPNIPADPIKTPILAVFREQLQEALGTIKKKEDSHFEYLRSLVPIHRELTGKRKELLRNAPPKHKIRFAHTYKVIQPFIFVDKRTKEKIDLGEEIQKIDPRDIEAQLLNRIEVVYFNERKHPNWYKREEEVAELLDDNGIPLEVDDDGTVLLDKWWHEIGQNEWQIKIIAKKDAEVLKKELGFKDIKVKDDGSVEFIGTPTRTIRKIDPKFVDYIDILEMATYISNDWDTFRDDLRDGRYHPWSKTAHDYVISVEEFGMYVPYEVKKIKFPMKPIRGTYNPRNLTIKYSYINARPDYFETSEFEPSDEKSINKRFRMRLLDGTLYPTDEMLKKDPYADLRRPSHLSPAFDRRAINFATEWMHWGRMYYYEWPDSVNKWSENPYPHISTRGVSKYIIHRILNDTFKYEDAVRSVEDEVGYDIGVRRPIVGGDFLKNPLKKIMS